MTFLSWWNSFTTGVLVDAGGAARFRQVPGAWKGVEWSHECSGAKPQPVVTCRKVESRVEGLKISYSQSQQLCSFACLTSPLHNCYVRTHHLLCCCYWTVQFSSSAGLGVKQPATSAVCQLQNGCLTLRPSKSGGRAGLSA